MEAVILHNGNAVRITEYMSSYRFNTHGFLSRFEYLSEEGPIEYAYIKTSNLLGQAVDEFEFTNGYYRVDKYKEYMSTRRVGRGWTVKLKEIRELQKDHGFVFEKARTGDTVKVRILNINISNLTYYSRTSYSFNHTEDKNYRRTDTFLERLNLSLLGDGITSTVDTTGTYARAFFDRHITAINTLAANKKEEFALAVILTSLRINAVVRKIFPILSFECAADSDVSLLITTIQNNWQNEALFNTITFDKVERYRSNLNRLYSWAYKNELAIKNTKCEDRLKLLIGFLSYKGLKVLPYNIKEKAITSIIDDKIIKRIVNDYVPIVSPLFPVPTFSSNEFNYDNQELVLKIIASITETKVDTFLDYLLQVKDGDKTNYEFLYLSLDDSRLNNYPIVNWFIKDRTNRKHYVYAIYQLWQQSKYMFYHIPSGQTASEDGLNSQAYFLEGQDGEDFYQKKFPHLIFSTEENINSTPLYSRYITSNEYFEPKKDIEGNIITINQVRKQRTIVISSLGDENNYVSNPAPEIKEYGKFHLYQPITLMGYKANLDLEIPTGEDTIIPSFLFHYAVDYDNIKDFDAAVSLAIEITGELVLFYFTGGLGTLSKLKHLKHITKIGRAIFVPSTLAGEQILLWEGLWAASETVTVLSAALFSASEFIRSTTNDLDEQELQKELSEVLLRIMMIGGVASIATQAAIANATSKLVKRMEDFTAAGKPIPFHPDLERALKAVNSKNVLVIANFENKLSALFGSSDNFVYQQYLQFTKKAKSAFLAEFNPVINNATFWNKINNANGELMLKWKKLFNLEIPERSIPTFIIETELVNSMVRFAEQPEILPKLKALSSERRIQFVDEFRSISNSNLTKLNNNPEFIVTFLSHSPEGIKDYARELDLYFKHVETRPLLLSEQFSEVALLFDKSIINSLTYDELPNIRFLFDSEMSLSVAQDIVRIGNQTNDISSIALHLGIPEEVVRVAKGNYFVKEQFILNINNAGITGLQRGRFTKTTFDIQQWDEAVLNIFPDLTGRTKKEFKYLLAHEYVEGKLISDYGISYRGLDNNSVKVYNFGAHDIAPFDTRSGFFNLERINNSPPYPNENLTNLDEIVEWFVEFYKLQ